MARSAPASKVLGALPGAKRCRKSGAAGASWLHLWPAKDKFGPGGGARQGARRRLCGLDSLRCRSHGGANQPPLYASALISAALHPGGRRPPSCGRPDAARRRGRIPGGGPRAALHRNDRTARRGECSSPAGLVSGWCLLRPFRVVVVGFLSLPVSFSLWFLPSLSLLPFALCLRSARSPPCWLRASVPGWCGPLLLVAPSVLRGWRCRWRCPRCFRCLRPALLLASWRCRCFPVLLPPLVPPACGARCGRRCRCLRRRAASRRSWCLRALPGGSSSGRWLRCLAWWPRVAGALGSSWRSSVVGRPSPSGGGRPFFYLEVRICHILL